MGCIALGLILTWQTALGEWAETRAIGIFEIRSEFELQGDSLHRMMSELADLQDDVSRLLNLQPGTDPIEINMFQTRGSYREYLSVRVPQGASRPALFVRGQDMGRVYVYRHWGLEQDLRHECTHALLHNSLPYVPLWLDEGFAEYFEVPASRRSTGNVHLGELKRRILFGWKPDLDRLERREDLTEMTAEDYRESWGWAHFMLHGPMDVRQVLSDYLYDVESGNVAGRLSERLRARIPDVEDQLVAHLRNWGS